MTHQEKAIEGCNCKIAELKGKKEEIENQIKVAENAKEFFEKCIPTDEAISFLRKLQAQKMENVKNLNMTEESYNGKLIIKQINLISDLCFLLETQTKIS